jgi:type IV pilus assembly protein PilQ
MNNKKLCLIFFTLIFMGGVLIGQDDSMLVDEPIVSIHAEDTHLPTILSILAKQSDYNIVTGPNVDTQEKLTIHLDEVPISQAINLIIRASGLSYEIIGNSILVANKSKLNSDIGVKPHIINLEYANASQVATLLKNITESITIDNTGNNLLVSASPKKINEIEAIVNDIDVPAIQIMLEARLIEVSLSNKQEFGVDWEKLARTSIIFAESHNALLSNGNTQTLLPGYEMVEETDASGNAVLSLDQLGTALGILPESMPWTIDPTINTFGRQLTAFDVTLDMLLKDNKADILTNSQVVTLNGHEARIDMVDEIPYLAQSGGASGNMQVLKEVVGIRLKILPTVNSDGYITTEITPEVSSIVDWTALGYPWTKKRKSTTTIRVRDGEQIVIAGLVTTNTIDIESKFPLLWRIPWIGKKIFTHTTEEQQKTDLIIQVKPTIVKDNYSGIDKQYYHEDAEGTLEMGAKKRQY